MVKLIGNINLVNDINDITLYEDPYMEDNKILRGKNKVVM